MSEGGIDRWGGEQILTVLRSEDRTRFLRPWTYERPEKMLSTDRLVAVMNGGIPLAQSLSGRVEIIMSEKDRDELNAHKALRGLERQQRWDRPGGGPGTRVRSRVPAD